MNTDNTNQNVENNATPEQAQASNTSNPVASNTQPSNVSSNPVSSGAQAEPPKEGVAYAKDEYGNVIKTTIIRTVDENGKPKIIKKIK